MTVFAAVNMTILVGDCDPPCGSNFPICTGQDVCEKCTSDVQCIPLVDLTAFCTKAVCISGKCWEGPKCANEPVNQYCSFDGDTCIPCTADIHCTDPAKPHCLDMGSGITTCAECTDASHCDDGIACTTDGCEIDNTGGKCFHDSSQNCIAPQVCSPLTGQCVSPCTGDSDCPPTTPCYDFVCNSTTQACDKVLQCPGDKPFCHDAPSALDEYCAECLDDMDCQGSSPTCIGAGTNTAFCAECVDSMDCTGYENCKQATCSQYTCGMVPITCESDNMFCNGEETCDADTGQCVSPGDPCPSGTVCIEDLATCVPEQYECITDADCSSIPCGSYVCDMQQYKCSLVAPTVCDDDAIFCNGPEVCDGATNECGHQGSPCAEDETCDESSARCVIVTPPVPVPSSTTGPSPIIPPSASPLPYSAPPVNFILMMGVVALLGIAVCACCVWVMVGVVRRRRHKHRHI